jgi:hypothetical protein
LPTQRQAKAGERTGNEQAAQGEWTEDRMRAVHGDSNERTDNDLAGTPASLSGSVFGWQIILRALGLGDPGPRGNESVFAGKLQNRQQQKYK